MPGYILFILMGFGIGALIPGIGRLGFQSPGLRLYVGIGFAPIAAFALHRIGGISLKPTVFILVALAIIGILLIAWRLFRTRPPLVEFFNPAILLPVSVGLIALIFGEINYLPYSGDEFSGWLNVAKQINALERYAPEAMKFLQADYTPGWPLLMSFPGLLLGQFEERMLALTPVAMHAGLLGLVFDLCNRALDQFSAMPAIRRAVYSWAVVLLMLGAEASGQLVARNLLVEPPQIYGMSVIMVLVAAMFLPGTDRKAAAFLIGLAYSILYFIKVSALTLLPPLVFLACMLAAFEISTTGKATWVNSLGEGIRKLAINMALIVLPGVVLVLFWKSSLTISTPTGSPTSVLQLELIAKAFSARALDITRELVGAVWSYGAAYKAPVSWVALAGIFVAAFNPRWRLTIAVLGLFIIVYFGALNWYHVTVWDAELKSIQRFSRVPIRVFHLMGLLFLVLQAAEFLTSRHGRGLKQLIDGRLVFGATIVLVVVLTGLQIFQTDRRITDLSTREFQHVAASHSTIPIEAKSVVRLLQRFKGRTPKILAIEQGGNPDVLEVIYYHLISNYRGSGIPDVGFFGGVSWTPPPDQPSGEPAKPFRLFAALSGADIIWPVRLDSWIAAELRQLVRDSGCAEPLLANILLVEARNPLSLTCHPKPRLKQP